MKVDSDTLPIQERYDHLLSVISGERFLKKQGLGNDIPFFICPFPPREAVPMDRMRQQLKNRLQQQGIVILEINLYDLTVEILKKRKIWEHVLDIEKRCGQGRTYRTSSRRARSRISSCSGNRCKDESGIL